MPVKAGLCKPRSDVFGRKWRGSGSALPGGFLEREDFTNAHLGQGQKIMELFPGEIVLLTSGLNFDNFSGAGHHHVHIHLGIPIFRIVEVEDRLVLQQSHANGGHGGA